VNCSTTNRMLAGLQWGFASFLFVFNVNANTPNPPSLQGTYSVGCSNVELDLSKLRAGESAAQYADGTPDGSRVRYINDIFAAPSKALTYSLSVPPRSQIDVFERYGGSQVPYAAIACYPTTAENNRANYTLPDGTVIPKMERGEDAPIIRSNPNAVDGKWPLIVLSHGLGGAPSETTYLQVIARFAAEGYIVYAPFHADARFARTKVEDFSDFFYVLNQYEEIAEMQAMRAIGLKQGLDNLLARAGYQNAIDQDQIVAFGASLGGMATMLVQGAKMTASWGGRERVIVRDNRYKALVGYVPFAGYNFLAAFGDSNQGVKSVRVPYLGLGGTADIVAPISRSSQMASALSGSKYFVTIEGMPHGLRAQDAPELFGWTFAFFKAQLSRNQADRDQFAQIVNFAANADDRVVLRKKLGWGSRDELEVVEFQSKETGKYFMTGRSNEIALLDSFPAIWQRTGQRFAMVRLDGESALGPQVCRFWANDGASLNTHFFSQSENECAFVRAQPWASDEGYVMRTFKFLTPLLDIAGAAPNCPGDTLKVIRMFNQSLVNHRYVIESLASRMTPSPQWAVEGSVFCAADYAN
jgi:predicted dienelactone hydrolase